jgi:hypothetical protein
MRLATSWLTRSAPPCFARRTRSALTACARRWTAWADILVHKEKTRRTTTQQRSAALSRARELSADWLARAKLLLLQRGASPRVTCAHGHTPLHDAISGAASAAAWCASGVIEARAPT